ncbi:MAG: polysaccharide export protein [Candidatus Omnitrophica bacterium]|nr:polysaccharide export protein [Candidatus Omnitrophota bacterium]
MITQIGKHLLIVISIFFVSILNPSVIYSEEYKVESGDVLLITVYEQPDLTTKVRVSSKGEISFPLLDIVDVKGLPVNEIEKKLAMLLEKDYLVNPQVNVFIEKYHAKKVFVMGFVNKPGEYDLFKDRPTTVLEAITMAGGFKEGAALNNTKIIRVEDDKQVTIPIKVTDITKKGNKDKDVRIKADDIIVVPESFF